jgi:hypothetical protein
MQSPPEQREDLWCRRPACIKLGITQGGIVVQASRLHQKGSNGLR